MSSTPVLPVLTTLLTAAEAATNLKIHPVTILRWAREDKIPHIRLGRKVLFSPEQITSWLSSEYTGSAVRAA
jgi:excisionase family DNA binding protein